MTGAGSSPAAITRDLDRAARDRFDLIVVGGGIYGACVALEAARRGLRPALVERGDFGGGTSWNSLRIVHGGLRYLQGLDLPRFRESVRERRWFCSTFPELVRPLRCLMPLYGEGLKRPLVFRVALALNDALSADRNRGVAPAVRLPRGRVISSAEIVEAFPGVDRRGLRGGASWHDGVMLSTERVLIEILRWACACGALALNHVEATALHVEAGEVRGVTAVDRESGGELAISAPVVINCAGPWSRALAGRFDRDLPRLFHPSLAFNVLFDRPPPAADAAVAVDPRGAPDGRTYFVQPWKGRTLAGTFHAPWNGAVRDGSPDVPDEELDRFLGHLRLALPDSRYERHDVLRVYAGLLPAAAPGEAELTRRPVIRDHAAHGGPRGLWSLAGIKYTTSRDVALRCLRAVLRSRGAGLAVRSGSERPAADRPPELLDAARLLETDPADLRRTLEALLREEAALHLDDLLLRRMDGVLDEPSRRRFAALVAGPLGWSESRADEELRRLDQGPRAAAPVAR